VKRLLWLSAGLALLAGCSAEPAGSNGTGSSGASSSSGSTLGGTSGSSAGASSSTGSSGAGSTGGGSTLAARYPGDVGIDADPAVVWHEDFEEGSVDAVVARYDDHKNTPGMQLVADVPPGSAGTKSMQWTAHGSQPDATDVFKKLPDHDALWARWYVKYQPGVSWHHTGVWLGGYNPAETYPNPQAGSKPNGDDRFSVSIEPVEGIGSASPRLDFYNYWMTMHSWMAVPDDSGTAYYGNSLVHQNGFTNDEGQWMCLEVHLALNTAPGSAAGGELEVWKNDALVQRFGETGALGYWLRDKFCTTEADGPECTDYPPNSGTAMIPLDLQFRSTTALHINAFWPQNYITDGASSGAVQFDDMVLATERIGCLR